MADAEAPQISLSHPAVLELAHPELSASGLFQLAYALDGFELRSDPSHPGRRLKDTFTVDVLEVAPTSSKIRVTPKRRLTQFELTAAIEQLLSQVPRGIFPDKLRIERVVWDVPGSGMASDDRGTMGRIK